MNYANSRRLHKSALSPSSLDASVRKISPLTSFLCTDYVTSFASYPPSLPPPYLSSYTFSKVFKMEGVIYLEVVMTDRTRGKMDRTSYWGRRFETLCILGVEGARLDELQRGPDGPARPSYCGLYRSRLGSHNLLMGGFLHLFFLS